MDTKKIYIGTSGWSYKDWKEIYYPSKMKPAEWLSFYAQEFDTTEINASFYRLPTEKTVINWVNKVPEGFKFCPKMNKYLTHLKKLTEPEEPLERFFSVFDHMGTSCGPILVQLPPSLHYDADTTIHFFELLKDKHAEYDFALEVRHNSWLEKEPLALLKKYNIAFVISQSGVGFPYKEVITSHNIYVRFHGPKELYKSLYTNEEMKGYATKFKRWIKSGHTVWVYFNNDYYGNGIANARMVKNYMGI